MAELSDKADKVQWVKISNPNSKFFFWNFVLSWKKNSTLPSGPACFAFPTPLLDMSPDLILHPAFTFPCFSISQYLNYRVWWVLTNLDYVCHGGCDAGQHVPFQGFTAFFNNDCQQKTFAECRWHSEFQPIEAWVFRALSRVVQNRCAWLMTDSCRRA